MGQLINETNPVKEDAINLGAVAQMRMENGGVRTQLSLPDMIGVTARLAQVLAQEVDCLNEMRVRDMEKLQDEKRQLMRTLMIMKREIDRRPELKATFSEADKASFAQVAEIFHTVLQENHRKLLVAKEINLQVVQAISDVVKEEVMQSSYNQGGYHGTRRDTPSVSLNKTI